VEFNRNHYLIAGLVLLFVGIQLRLVDSYVLNEATTRVLTPQSTGAMTRNNPLLASITPTPRKVIKPPEWLGWALMSVGSVLVLHALAMKAPGGGDH
jgi:hypothetical protein